MLDRLLYTDLKTYLVELLMKQDQMSMAASIESRVPFLDHQLVEFAAALPPRIEAARVHDQVDPARGGEGRSCRARSSTRPKMGFPVPFGIWLRGAWSGVARDVLLDSRTPRSAASSIRPPSSGCSTAHAAGAADGGDAIWSLLNLELWYRTFIDGDGVQTLPRAPAPLRAERAAGARRRRST